MAGANVYHIQVDCSHLFLPPSPGATAQGFLLVSGATLVTRRHPVVRSNALMSLPELLPARKGIKKYTVRRGSIQPPLQHPMLILLARGSQWLLFFLVFMQDFFFPLQLAAVVTAGASRKKLQSYGWDRSSRLKMLVTDYRENSVGSRE